MKRIKNFVIGGIENKVFNLILMTVILLTAAYLAVSAYHGKMLKDLAADSAERQQTAIEETISSVMDSVVDSSMYRSTGLEAYIVNEIGPMSFRDVTETARTFTVCSARSTS